MKKLFCLLLVLICLPVVSYCDEIDPIVGCWYVIYDVTNYSDKIQKEFQRNIHILDTQLEVHVYRFTEKGEIYKSMTQFHEYYSDAHDYSIVGTFSKTDNGTYMTVIDSVIGDAYFENNNLIIKSYNNKYITLRKMIPLDFSTDVKNKK